MMLRQCFNNGTRSRARSARLQSVNVGRAPARCLTVGTSSIPEEVPRNQYNRETSQRNTRQPSRQPSSPFNASLQRAAESTNLAAALKTCHDMKSAGYKPNAVTYTSLMNLFGSLRLPEEAFACFEDMKAVGVSPTVGIWNSLIQASSRTPGKVFPLLEEMRASGIEPNAATLHNIVAAYEYDSNLDMCLQLLDDMAAEGLTPSLPTAEAVIMLAARLGHPRLAVDLTQSFESTSSRRLEGHVWMSVLIACTDKYYLDGARIAWSKAVNEFGINPDEGLCIEMLNMAARQGAPEVATDVIKVLRSIGVPLQERHLAPLIEAFALAKQLREAFAVLSLMRSNDVNPTEGSVEVLQNMLSANVDALDEAYTTLEALKAEGKTVDVEAVNVVIRSAIALNDWQRAIGIYKECSDLGAKPDLNTFHAILRGAVSMGHRSLGDKLLADLREAGYSPNATTYSLLIDLCLTQKTYEDAFFYLEEMKSAGIMPPYSVYEGLTKKCHVNEDPRRTLVLQELKEVYTVSSRLQEFLDRGAERPYGQTRGGDSRGGQRGRFDSGDRERAPRDFSRRPQSNMSY